MQHKAIDAGREEAQPIDKLLITVSPPDEHGWCCVRQRLLGRRVEREARAHVVAEMN